ncbi:uncharacterized protein KY384_006309 [Bacidia gigantensis]|uniref:uncharacterized protein n=1 Tax=Bacidia gigantensis TaxID=2732470 RepID=UPI001D051207|nr:uncharacterized protein KY384_006309 [Bacidia gigantensis]KAG8528622.1 hypothetical protein KY384_006309 [Bacidia gigantensis]
MRQNRLLSIILLLLASGIAYIPYSSQPSQSRRSIAQDQTLDNVIPNSVLSSSLRPRAQEQGAANFTFKELYRMQKKFLDAFIYPANQKEAKKINSTIFSEDVQGRVDITRTFSGRELNTEYIFGLFSNLAASSNDTNAFSLLGYATSYKILHFAASQNIASASTIFQFTFPILPTPVPLVIDTWNVFNAQGQISMYDATFKWWDWAVDSLFASLSQKYNATLLQTVQLATQKIAGSICDIAIKHCNGTNAQYESMQQCEDFLTKKVAFGKSYQLGTPGRNTLLCRMVHQNMVPFRPTVHCPHIGPSGGGYCVDDKSYGDVVGDMYFSNMPFGYSDRGAL